MGEIETNISRVQKTVQLGISWNNSNWNNLREFQKINQGEKAINNLKAFKGDE